MNSDKSRAIIKSGQIVGERKLEPKKNTGSNLETLTFSDRLTLTKTKLDVFESKIIWK